VKGVSTRKVGRARKSRISSSSTLQIRDTSLLEMPSIPSARTRSSRAAPSAESPHSGEEGAQTLRKGRKKI